MPPDGINIVTFLALILSGGFIIYSLWIVLISLTFWFTKFDNNVTLMQALMDTGRYPAVVYPGWLRYSVTFLVPVAFAVTVPAEALTSRLEWQTALLALGFAVALFAFTRWFWRFGLRHYSGASA